MITSHLFFITLIDNLRRYPIFYYIGAFLLPKLTFSVRNQHSQFSRDKVDRFVFAFSFLVKKKFLTGVEGDLRVSHLERIF
jgi:hypothetical protein